MMTVTLASLLVWVVKVMAVFSLVVAEMVIVVLFGAMKKCKLRTSKLIIYGLKCFSHNEVFNLSLIHI